jgi:signal transduction histidine kinase
MRWKVANTMLEASGRRNVITVALILCIVIATATMTWLGYRSTREWVSTTRVSVERHGNELLALLVTALNYDMKGAHISVLVPINQSNLNHTRPYDLADRFARAFARFPYPESFFSWANADSAASPVYFFSRADRPPRWRVPAKSDVLFPVVIDTDPTPMRELALAARALAVDGTPLAVFETEIDGIRYQVIVHFIYSGEPSRLFGLVGFTVNLPWTREHYFRDLITQIERLGGERNAIDLEILDDNDNVVAGGGRSAPIGVAQSRHFPMIFADRALLSLMPRSQRVTRDWTARVRTERDPTLLAVARSSSRALWLLALALGITIAALATTLHAAREAAALTAARTAFFSSVSHEMKTPLSLIRLASDTLVKGRYTSKLAMEEYSRMLAFEAEQLTHLVDNVLNYARIADAKSVRSFDPIDLTELLEESLERFHPRLSELQFDVRMDIPADLPLVLADRTLLQQLVDNLVDNALKYAAAGKALTIRVWEANHRLYLEVIDRGPGIPAEDLPRVFDKFYRGRGVKERGSGLGLSIVRQVAQEHRGEVSIHSTADHGTSVTVWLPITHGA